MRMLLTVMLLPMIVMITWVSLLDFSSIARAFTHRWSLVIDDYAVVEDHNDYNVGVLY